MTDKQIVRVKSAPGLKWKKRDGGRFEARWQCRDDLVKRPDFNKFNVKSVKLWSGHGDPTLEEWDFIADTCGQLQQEMLVWANGGLPQAISFDGTIAGLIRCYKNDPDSPYRKKGRLRYASRVHYDTIMRMVEADHGHEVVSEIKGRTINRWYDRWTENGRFATAHTKIQMLRILFGFGTSILEDDGCIRLRGVLSGMKFQTSKHRTERLTIDQVVAIRTKAHEMERPSIAIAQAFQFECMFRQKDCIGSWEPISEPGVSAIFDGSGLKWMRGIRWEEIDQNLVLTHITSKRQKEIKVNLRSSPMVMEEFALLVKVLPEKLSRDMLPAAGPIVISEFDDLPWEAIEFRRWWRKLADECGIPKSVRNMDSRAGAISEAIAAGAKLEHVRHGATHSDISMTQRYDRGVEEAIATVQKLRVASRNKPGTE